MFAVPTQPFGVLTQHVLAGAECLVAKCLCMDLPYLQVKLPFDALTQHVLAGAECIVTKCMFCIDLPYLQVMLLFGVLT